ncbi:Death on curing protein, Doc toxin [Chitinispirillum alkaliphilum]|nr:Death on curing protein, Doc toxin [Chitinispirillum alkaliphilum]
MVKKIRWSPCAAHNLEDICEFISKDSPRYASIFARGIINKIEETSQNPEIGRIVPEYGVNELRERIYGSYRIIYRLSKTSIEVVAIVHGSRLIK